MVRGKSGQRRIRQPLTAAGRDPRESATETIPPLTIFRRTIAFMGLLRLEMVRGKGERSEVRAHSLLR